MRPWMVLLLVALLSASALAASDPAVIKPGGVFWTDGERSILFSGFSGNTVVLWVQTDGCGYPLHLPMIRRGEFPVVWSDVLIGDREVEIRARLDRDSQTLRRL